MSTEIDDNIVSMKFDNAAFERRMSETIKSLDKLRKSLDLSNASKGIEGVNAAAKNLSLGNIAQSVEGIAGKFKAMSVVAIAALGAIAVKGVTAAGRLVSSFTLKPIMEGFQEFETNMNSIQTILSNTKADGSTLKDVNKALDQLNIYSDKTIYNFSQMARNIGTFTAAGVGLQDSVNAIKGIANLAAISGSSSEQASTAMYQLSQALAAGKVSLMDWNSVVNAGMGGEVFKKALFETGKAMKTITDVPLGASFEEWEKKGGTFREQMQKGWITADVLRTTLGAFSGDLDEAALKTMGFGEEAAKQMVELGKTGIAAATEVKTLTQLLSTVKESVSSGWSMTFRTVIGDFAESKKLFTGINNAIGGFVSKSADARNELLKGWKKVGGRTDLLQGLENAFYALGRVLSTVRNAFREVFPEMTVKRLVEITKSFVAFTDKLNPSKETLAALGKIAEGFFSIFKIGATIIKEFFKQIVGPLLGSLSGVGSGLLDAGESAGNFIIKLRKMLVEGGGIRRFFQNMGKGLSAVIAFFGDIGAGIEKVRDKFVGFFRDSSALNAIGERVGQRFGMIGRAISKLGDALQWVSDRFQGVRKVMGKIWEFIKDFFSNLGKSIAATMKPGDFDPAVDVLNVGLLGGILLILRKMSKGFSILFSGELGDKLGGLVDDFSNTLGALTGTLKAMQAEIKSRAIRNIAVSVGILAASVTVLSLIDSAALAKALAAMTVAFGQLMGSMLLLEKLNFSGTGARLGALAAGMILLSVAALILSVAIKNLASLGWEELAKGLLGVSVSLAAMMASTQLLAANTGGMIRAGVGMIGIAIAMLILSKAVKEFAEMSWGEMAKGLIGVGVALGVITAVMNLMPVGQILATGVAMIPLAIGLLILSKAVSSFGNMDWGEMGKGLLGIGAALAIIAVTVSAMPVTLPIIAVGLIGVGVAMLILAKAISTMGNISFGEMVKGIGGMAAVLLILAVALNSMTGAVPGAIALGIAAVSLMVLAKVIKTLGGMKIGDLVKGILAMAIAIGVIAAMALGLQAAIPFIAGLGIALAIVGGSFALFGLGAILVAKSLEILAKSGVASIKTLISALPQLVYAFIKSLSKIAEDILNAAPLFVEMITTLLSAVLDTVIELVPKIAEAISVIIDQAIILITEKFPKLVNLGFNLLTQLLLGVRNKIPAITLLVVDIIARFVNTLAMNVYKLVNAGINLLTAFLTAIGNRASQITAAGLNVLLKFISGIADNVFRIVNTVGTIISKFITTISENHQKIVNAGVDAVVRFVEGLGENANRVVTAGTNTVIDFITGIGKNALKIAEAAMDVIIDFVNGLSKAIDEKAPELQEAGRRLAGSIADGLSLGLASKAGGVISKAKDIGGGILGGIADITGVKSPSKETMKIGRFLMEGLALGMDDDIAKNSAVKQAERIVSALHETLSKTPESLGEIGDINPVITPILDLTEVKNTARNIDKLISVSSIVPVVSIDHAQLISTSTNREADVTEEPSYSGPSEITFVQNNHSPKPLSANDIYRSTRSQIALAKEELNIQ